MKKKTEIIENPSGLKAVNAFIFAGSFSLGVMKAGFDLLKVLEISNDQLAHNAFYFKKNVDVPVILPDEWENDAYLDALKDEKIDLMCCNCPCSSLSQINRNASVDGKNNVHFYRLFNIFNHVEPKVFVIENAPTLVHLGWPILKDMVEKLSSKYRFTVIRDAAGNHEVPMMRLRTLVVGWHRDVFKSCPIVEQDAHKEMTVDDTLAGINENAEVGHPSETLKGIDDLYKYAIPGCSLMTGLARRWIADENNFKSMLETRLKGNHYLDEVKRIAKKIELDQNRWDKSPCKLVGSKRFPSFTSVTEYIHPRQDRMLSLKELGRIMNYPDWYDFTDPDKECKTPLMQAMAQGVPVNFGKYIASQARKALQGELKSIDDSSIDFVFQHHSQHKMSMFTKDELWTLPQLDLKSGATKLDR